MFYFKDTNQASRTMKRLLKILFIVFIVSAFIGGILEAFEEEVNEEAIEEVAEVKAEKVEVAAVNEKTPEPVAVEPEEPSRYDQLQMIADSLFQTIPPSTYQARFKEIATNEDRALAVATKMHPDPNDFMERRDAQIILEERYFKMWADVKFDWYKELDLPEDEKYSVVYLIKSRISGIGVRNDW